VYRVRCLLEKKTVCKTFSICSNDIKLSRLFITPTKRLKTQPILWKNYCTFCHFHYILVALWNDVSSVLMCYSKCNHGTSSAVFCATMYSVTLLCYKFTEALDWQAAWDTTNNDDSWDCDTWPKEHDFSTIIRKHSWTVNFHQGWKNSTSRVKLTYTRYPPHQRRKSTYKCDISYTAVHRVQWAINRTTRYGWKFHPAKWLTKIPASETHTEFHRLILSTDPTLRKISRKLMHMFCIFLLTDKHMNKPRQK